MKANNTNNENTNLSRQQRRIVNACIRKKQPFNTDKLMPVGRKTAKGWGFVEVQTMTVCGVGE